MPQRVVIVQGQSSQLMHGDPEAEDPRFLAQLATGAEVNAALPALLQEGWVIESVTPLGVTTQATALVVIRPKEEVKGPGGFRLT